MNRKRGQRIVGLMFVLAFVAFPLLGQSQEDEPALEDDSTPDDSGSMPSGGGAVAPVPGGSVPEVYTVERGDTLWDLCQRFLNNPWYWPKIWAYNPKITNPHWIYPGDEVYFYPQEGQRPTPMETSIPLDPLEVSGLEMPNISTADVDRPVLLGEDGKPVIEVSGIHQIGNPQMVGRKGFFASRRDEEYISLEIVEGSGTIAYSRVEREMLAQRDEAYARFKDLSQVSVGDKFQVFRIGRELTHPFTEDDFDVVIQILGQAQVIAMNEQWATIKVTESWEDINRGDLLRPWKEVEKRVKLTKNQVDILDGAVVDAYQALEINAEHQMVFLDKGAEHGVRAGNQLAIIRRGDGLFEVDDEDLETLPDEIVGELVVIEAHPIASTCLVSRSLRAIVRGDRAVMRAAN